MENEVAASPESDVNAASSSAEATESVNTPPVENTGSENQGNQGPRSVPYSRFQEVIGQKNEYATRMEDMERRLSAYESNLVKNRPNEVVENAVSKLVAAGLDANAARLLVETQTNLMDTRLQDRLSPLEQRNQQYEVDRWVKGFASDHADYASLEPHMEKEFAKLSPAHQKIVAGNPEGLEMLYWKVKGQQSLGQVSKAQQIGANQAYQNMGQKAAMSSTPGSAPVKAALSQETIGKMSREEYAARRSEILDAYKKGLIK